jgi:hypothetical protein
MHPGSRSLIFFLLAGIIFIAGSCGSGAAPSANRTNTQILIPRDSLLACIRQVTQVLAANGGEEQLKQVFQSRASRYKIRLNQPSDTTQDKEMLRVFTTTIRVNSLPPAYRVELQHIPDTLQASLSLSLLQQWLGPWQQEHWNNTPNGYNLPVIFELPQQASQKNKVSVSVLSDPPGDTLHAHILEIAIVGARGK